MLISTQQIKQIHTMLQEYPTTTHVVIKTEDNGSGIGPSQFVDFYAGNVFKHTLLGTLEITDVGLW
jgi:hypothetical protein